MGDLSDDEAMSLMWKFIETHYIDIISWCKRAARGNPHLAEELFSDEVLRMMPNLIKRWDQTRPFYTYARSYFFLHLRKKAISRQKKAHKQLDENFAGMKCSEVDVNSLEATEYTDWLLDCLSPVDKFIVKNVVMKGLTLREVSELVPYTYTAVHMRLKRSLELLREQAGTRGE
jgi:RNA polymerase sigma factor (sigma-70 family)